MPSSPSIIHFFYEIPVPLRNRTGLKKFIQSIFKKEGRSLTSLNYIFCSDKRLLQINQQYLRHDYYTDIITFELSGSNLPVEGEVYISLDRVRENANNNGESLTRELHRVIFHGALHLCGYKDKTKADEKRMREREDFYLDSYFS